MGAPEDGSVLPVSRRATSLGIGCGMPRSAAPVLPPQAWFSQPSNKPPPPPARPAISVPLCLADALAPPLTASASSAEMWGQQRRQQQLLQSQQHYAETWMPTEAQVSTPQQWVSPGFVDAPYAGQSQWSMQALHQHQGAPQGTTATAELAKPHMPPAGPSLALTELLLQNLCVDESPATLPKAPGHRLSATKPGATVELAKLLSFGNDDSPKECSLGEPEAAVASRSSGIELPPGLPAPPGLELPLKPNSGGSALHGTGRCRPCAWFWKSKGCQNEDNCGHCHLCPEGEIKARKKAKKGSAQETPSSSPLAGLALDAADPFAEAAVHSSDIESTVALSWGQASNSDMGSESEASPCFKQASPDISPAASLRSTLEPSHPPGLEPYDFGIWLTESKLRGLDLCSPTAA